jgi:uncharacterized repeat protein (TIGR01451 family)
LDRLWYKSRTGSGGNVYSCGATVATRSCAANAWFTQLRAVDDDDGNLANGTPHAAAIFAAFSRHNIPCGSAADATNLSTTGCAALAAPVLTTTPGLNQIALSWTPVAGATSYNVLRNDQGCGWGFSVAANVASTTYTDTGLPNGVPMYYSIQAVGPVSACTGTLSGCVTAQAATISANLTVSKTAPPTATAGGSIAYSVTVSNAGPSTAQSVQLTDALPAGTTLQSIAAQAGWSCSTPAVGGTGTINCTAASLASPGVASFTITVRVNFCIGNGTVVPNTATVTSTTSDPNAGNNTASTVTTVSDSGACSDGNACNGSETCQSGSCSSGAPVSCTAPPPCCTAVGAACEPETGACFYPPLPDGTSCSDGDPCTSGNQCGEATCLAGTPVPPPGTVTHLAFTDPFNRNTLEWNTGSSATLYDVFRGDLSGLPVGPGGADEDCLGDTAANTLDDAAIPAGGFFYLVRAKNLCGDGGWGVERQNTAGGPVFTPRDTTACP